MLKTAFLIFLVAVIIFAPGLKGVETYVPYRYKLTWDQAKQFCNQRDSALAVIKSEEENNLVYEIAKKAFAPEIDFVIWIGLRRSGSSWKWPDGTYATYTKWARSQPDNYRYNEDCVHMYVRLPGTSFAKQMTDRQWNDHHCSHMTYFVCQKYCDYCS